MNLTIPIETSARHIHITEEDFHTLFGPGAKPTFSKELSQPGQYACKERLAVVGPKGRFEKVVILGPCRQETQVEISVTDARRLGIPSVIRSPVIWKEPRAVFSSARKGRLSFSAELLSPNVIFI